MTQQGTGHEEDEVDILEAKARERRRSSVSLALPNGGDQQGMTASVNIGAGQVEFEAHGVKINRDGLFIEGTNVSGIHQDDLRVLAEIGRGACSVVKQAQHVETRQLYAVKMFSVFDREKRAQLLKEVETLWAMECPSLLQFVGGYLQNGSIHVILEFMDMGDLTNLIHGYRDLAYGEDLMAAISFQMLWGLGYLHFEHHLHRDVKPQNVLLNSKGEVKLSDFGISRSLEGELDLAQTMVGTIRYMSPERLAGAGYGVAADVWSLGVVLLEMAARRLPFDTTISQIELHDWLEQELAVEDLIKLVPGYSPQFEEVLRGCLQSHPEDRLTPMELLELEWFRQFRRPAGQADEDEAVGRRQGSCVDSGEQDGAHRAAKYGDEGALEVGQKDDAGGRESNDGGNETHDLDRAAQVVRAYILKAVERGLLEDAGATLSLPQDETCRRRTGPSASGMIETMCSDGSDSDQGVFANDSEEHFGGFAGFRKERDEES